MKTNDDLILEQKRVADDILDRLYPIDPFAIVAGGAPRNWYFGLPAKDIDVYYHQSPVQTWAHEACLKRVGFNVHSVEPRSHSGLYKTLPNLRKVYRCEVEGVSVDIMLMGTPTFQGCVSKFGVNMSKIWYKNKKIHPTEDFLLGEKTKSLIIDKGYKTTDNYVQKVKGYFPDYLFMTEEQQLRALKRIVLHSCEK